jgi:PAS domain S-box-containing protein
MRPPRVSARAFVTLGFVLATVILAVYAAAGLLQTRNRIDAISGTVTKLIDLQDAIRCSDDGRFEAVERDLKADMGATVFFFALPQAIAGAKVHFQQIRDLETQLLRLEQHHVPAGSETARLQGELLEERSAASGILLDAQRASRREMSRLSAILVGQMWGLLIVIACLGVVVLLATFQIRRYRTSLRSYRKVEAGLRASESKYRSLFENVLEGVYQCTIEGRFVAANPAFVQMLGYLTEEEIKRVPATHLYVDPSRRQIMTRIIERDGVMRNQELLLKRRDGSEITVLNNARTVKSADGKSTYLEGTITDISARKKFEEALASARDEAVEASRLKSEFLSNVSHEIRTPMNGVIGMTNMLLDTSLTLEQREYASAAKRSAAHLMEIIDDILDFAKIEAGNIKLEQVEFCPRECIEDALEMLAEPAESTHVDLACVVADDVPERLLGDPGRLRQVLSNLAGNAVKFTDHGQVVVTLSVKERHAGRVTLKFEVEDSGIGITKEQMARVFEPFTQGDGSSTRKHGGAGLGLPISRRIVEQMNGTLEAKSAPGLGSTFSFTASFGQVEQMPSSHRPKFSPLRDARVLIVEDNKRLRGVMVAQAQSWGMVAAECAEGSAVPDKLRGSARWGEPFDFVLIDCQAPGVNAPDLVRAIRSNEMLANLEIILMTNFSQHSVLLACWDRESVGIITKPVRSHALQDLLIHRRTGKLVTLPDPEPEVASGGQPEGFLVLIAEDNLVNQRVAQRMIEKLGHEVDVVGNGAEAVDAVLKRRYDLVLMDCQMPEMDGLEATAEIRRRQKSGRRISIVAMTAHAMAGDRERCLSAGMDDYLTKPVKPEELAAVLERWLPWKLLAANAS